METIGRGTKTITGTFMDAANALIDPDEVLFTSRLNSGPETTVEYPSGEMENPSPGVYTIPVTLTPGRWTLSFTARNNPGDSDEELIYQELELYVPATKNTPA